MNPPVVIESYSDETVPFRVVRDDVLPGGTKQRALLEYLTEFDADEFVYAGPNTGYAQIGLAYAASQLKKRTRLFLQGVMPSPLTRRAESYGAVTSLHGATLADTEKLAEEYVTQHPDATLVPFGLDDARFRQLLLEALREATKDVSPPKRVWITWGSGTLAETLAELWPRTRIIAVQVGKGIYIEKLSNDLRRRLTIYDAKKYYKFHEAISEKERPPYPSLATYDGKVWLFHNHIQPYDLIWNVGAD